MALLCALSAPLGAQEGSLRRLTGPEKAQLLAIAREPLDASLEGRPIRDPTVGDRLLAVHPLLVSLYLEGKLVARCFELQRPGPLAIQAMSLAARLLESPQYGAAPDPAVLPGAKIAVAILGRFKEIESDLDLREGEGVVVLSGFKEGVAVWGDLAPGQGAKDLLSLASVVAGMRPGGWLTPSATLLSAPADEARER
ncbi:MAG: hypothetical protein LBO66_15075 [Deltaproteobacteria bacterium]|nr:hypothetical protein [Deltaproteobacteria bacterium]